MSAILDAVRHLRQRATDGLPPPERVQRRREKGWRMPANTVYVGRGTRWGNPFNDTQQYIGFPSRDLPSAPFPVHLRQLRIAPSRDRAIDFYAVWLKCCLVHDPEFLAPLYGRNLCCWCSLDEACHADVLLWLASPDQLGRRAYELAARFAGGEGQLK